MAKKTKSKKKVMRPRGNGVDPTVFALIHWFAVSIEKLALEVYVTNGSSADDLKRVLTATLTGLGKVKAPNLGEDECPDPWVWCSDRGRCCGDCGSGAFSGDNYEDD